MAARSSMPSACELDGISAETGAINRRASRAIVCTVHANSDRPPSSSWPHGARPSVSPVWGACRSLTQRSLAADTQGAAPAPDLVARDFNPTAPNVTWAGDITYVRSWEGWLFCAVVLDLYSRRVIGWALADHLRALITGQGGREKFGRTRCARIDEQRDWQADRPITLFGCHLRLPGSRFANSEGSRADEQAGGRSVTKAALARAYAMSKRSSQALAVLDEMQPTLHGRPIPPFYLAVVHAGLGDKDEALKWLEKAYEERSYRMVYLAVDPAFNLLRNDPRFDRLLNRVNPQLRKSFLGTYPSAVVMK